MNTSTDRIERQILLKAPRSRVWRMLADAEAFGCPLFGGDTDRTPGPLMISIAMIGSVPTGTMVRRAGAKAGDLVFVTGTIGDAALGLVLRKGAAWPLTDAQRDHLLSRYLLPQPRNALAEAVRTHASAAMDVSDGLVGDLAKLCAASGVSAAMRIWPRTSPSRFSSPSRARRQR